MTMRQLTTMEKLSFGGGDVANCVTFGVTPAYLSYYYTDTVLSLIHILENIVETAKELVK